MALTSPSSSARERDAQPGSDAAGRDRRPGLTPLSLFLVLLLAWVLVRIELVLVLALLALLFGTIIERPVQLLEQRRVPRPLGILLIYVAIIGTLVLLAWSIAPGIADQVATFNAQVPGQLEDLREDWQASSNGLLSGAGVQILDQMIERLAQPAEVSEGTAQAAIPVITNITAFVVGTLTLLVITFYYVMEKALLRRLVLDQLSPESRTRVNRVWDDVEAKVGGWMRGQLVLCLIIGTIATVSYGVVGLRFWPLLGLWAGLTEIVPIIGPWIGGIPAVIIALTMSWEKAIIVAGVILAMQTLENWVLVPRVMRGAVGLTPLTVFVAILAGTQLMGVVGAVLAIPIAATVQVILTDYFDARRGKRSPADPLSGWRWMLSRSGREQGEPAGPAGPLPSPVARADRQPPEPPARPSSSPSAPANSRQRETGVGNGADRPVPTASDPSPVAARHGQAMAKVDAGRRAVDGWSRSALERISRPSAGPPAAAPPTAPPGPADDAGDDSEPSR